MQRVFRFVAAHRFAAVTVLLVVATALAMLLGLGVDCPASGSVPPHRAGATPASPQPAALAAPRREVAPPAGRARVAALARADGQPRAPAR
jgi:hypothetical protein